MARNPLPVAVSLLVSSRDGKETIMEQGLSILTLGVDDPRTLPKVVRYLINARSQAIDT